MKVELISLTQSVVMHDEAGRRQLTAEELLVYIARVSNPANQMNHETADRLIKYMIDHKHWSPFDMINMCVGVTTSKAIAIQILRHWSIKPQEFSQRYAEATGVEPIDVRLQAQKNRQSSTESIGTILPVDTDAGQRLKLEMGTDIPEFQEWLRNTTETMDRVMWLYREALRLGIAKETARMILPMATSTTIYLNGSIRSWIHYLEQRTDAHAQVEHQQVANQIKSLFMVNFPNISKALNLTW